MSDRPRLLCAMARLQREPDETVVNLSGSLKKDRRFHVWRMLDIRWPIGSDVPWQAAHIVRRAQPCDRRFQILFRALRHTVRNAA